MGGKKTITRYPQHFLKKIKKTTMIEPRNPER
jgi:hypothetical protein